jgi:photosystem II stability/assembly factor-like uncharacterized protein
MARPAIGRGAATLAVFLLPLGGAVPSALSASTARVAYGLDVVRLESASLALVGLSASPTRTKVPPARLLVSASFGGRFADISPRLAPATHVDDVQFLDRKHGWVVIYNLDTVGVTVYRTSDGGRTWKSTAAGSHSMAAGSVATVQFLTRRRGWLVEQNPTGPVAYLLASTDGGARWHKIAALPEVAPVEFVSPTEAWQAGGEFSLRLFHSSDGGRRWRRVRVPIPPHERMAHVFYGSLAFFGHEILAPVTFVRGRDAELDVYRSTDDGRSWRRVATLAPTGREPAPCLPAPLSVAFTTADDWWVAAYPSGRPVAYQTTDAGRRWRTIPITAHGAVAACPLPDVQAVSAGSAWVMLRTAHDFALYATSDAGAHWHPLHPTGHP